MKKFISMLLVLLMATAAFSGCAPAANNNEPTKAPETTAPANTDAPPAATDSGAIDPSKLKVAVLLNGTITDGWSSAAYAGIESIKEIYKCETSYIESVSKQDMESVLRNYATEGYNIVFGHGREFADAIMAVAPEFTDTIFVINSFKEAQSPNVASLALNNREQGFLVGIVGAVCSKTGNMAAMNGAESDSIKDSIDGQRAALKYLRPDMKHIDSWTGDANDATKAYEMAITLNKDGVDIIVADPGQMSQGILKAATETGMNVIGVVGNLAEINPDIVITSARSSYGKAMVAFVDEVIKGTWEAKNYRSGIKEDAVFIEPLGKFESILTAEQKAKIEDTIAKVKSGEIDIDALIDG